MCENLWQYAGEEFNYSIPRLTGINVRENDFTNHFAFPSGWDSIGYNFDFSQQSRYDNRIKFRIDFGVYDYNRNCGSFTPTKVVMNRCMYYPSMLKRDFEFPHIGLKGTERMGQSDVEGLAWDFQIESSSSFFNIEKSLVTLLRSDEEFNVLMEDGALVIAFKDAKYQISCPCNVSWEAYESEESMKCDSKLNNPTSNSGSGRCLAIIHDILLKPLAKCRITFGLSEKSVSYALNAATDNNFEDKIRKKWNDWLNSLPKVSFTGEDEKKAYYKAWATVRSNYFNSPIWGHSFLEALPVYKGVWQWAMSAVEWLSDQDTYLTSRWFENSMDFFIKMQRKDGYLTHAMYIDEENPGERWSAGGIGTVQMPHFPWVALRYYYTTTDKKALRKWYQPLVEYYNYLNNTRDEKLKNIHLWAIFSSFDTGLDTTSVFQRVTYEEDGLKEEYCYPSIFGAARYRYEQSMGMMADILEIDSKTWYEEAEKTKAALDRYLWDNSKKWYGVMHEDGALDTRLGVDGLFLLSYHIVDEKRVRLMESNFEKLIGNYGIHTVAPGEKGFKENVYWRGAAWPQSCSVGIEAARYYYPNLLERVKKSIIDMTLSNPCVWECCNAINGKLAISDQGFVCTPSISTNVGAGGIIGSLFIYHGFDMYGIDDILPLTPMENFHWGGMRVNVVKEHNGWTIKCRKAEKDKGCLKFIDCKKTVHCLYIEEGQEVIIKD